MISKILPDFFYTMDFVIDTIFKPSTGVDLVFNIDSLAPYSRSSIIYDVDFKAKSIIIAQPNTPFTKNTSFKELHLTTIIQDKSRKVRVGIKCNQFKAIKNYTLANNTIVEAVALNYILPIKETNIRAAFRLILARKFLIKAKIKYNGLEYFTPTDFSIKDISLTGLGVSILKKRKNYINPLAKIKIYQEIPIGIILIDDDESSPLATFPLKAKVTRINDAYSETYCSVGMEFTFIKPVEEDILNKFIHNAQIDELKKMSRRDL